MGTYLSAPNTEKFSESGKFDLRDEAELRNLPFAVSEMQGWRKTMEDAHITLCNLEKNYDVPKGTSLFAVFDGHAGKEVAAFCAKHFVEELVELESFKARAYREALVECFHRMDDMLRDSRYRQEVNELKQFTSRPLPSIAKIETEDEREFADNNVNGSSNPDDIRKDSKDSSDSELDKAALALADDSNSDSLSKIDLDSMEDEADAESKEEPIDIKTLKDALKTPDKSKGERAESLNLTFMKDSLQKSAEGLKEKSANSEAVSPDHKDIKTNTNVQTKDVDEQKPEGTNEESSNSDDKISFPDNVQQKMKEAEEKGSISKSEALELMLSMLKITRKQQPAGEADKDNGSAPAQPPRDDFDEESHFGDNSFPTIAGCTAIVSLIINNKIYVANAGDSRGVLCDSDATAGVSRKVFAKALSFDHKPQNPGEKTRIEKAGGFVSDVGRVCGNLNLSRSIGDLKYKINDAIPRSEQIITAEPDVTITELKGGELFMVLACDGVWDMLTNDGIVEFIKKQLVEDRLGSAVEVVEGIFTRCLSPDPLKTQGLGGDNMTCILIFFKQFEEVVGTLAASSAASFK